MVVHSAGDASSSPWVAGFLETLAPLPLASWQGALLCGSVSAAAFLLVPFLGAAGRGKPQETTPLAGEQDEKELLWPRWSKWCLDMLISFSFGCLVAVIVMDLFLAQICQHISTVEHNEIFVTLACGIAIGVGKILLWQRLSGNAEVRAAVDKDEPTMIPVEIQRAKSQWLEAWASGILQGALLGILAARGSPSALALPVAALFVVNLDKACSSSAALRMAGKPAWKVAAFGSLTFVSTSLIAATSTSLVPSANASLPVRLAWAAIQGSVGGALVASSTIAMMSLTASAASRSIKGFFVLGVLGAVGVELLRPTVLAQDMVSIKLVGEVAHLPRMFCRWLSHLTARSSWPSFLHRSKGGATFGSAELSLEIALCMVAASLVGMVMKLIQQPLILGYLIAGFIVGPGCLGLIIDDGHVNTISSIGLIFLLFMVGMELDAKKMVAAGRFVTVTGAFQFPICTLLTYGALISLRYVGISVGFGHEGDLYVSLLVGFSSTMMVVKQLREERKIDTLIGRVTVGVLIFQDIWAILVISVQHSKLDPLHIMYTLTSGALVVTAAMLAAKYVLPKVYDWSSSIPELLIINSLGWCFLVALVASQKWVGLSMEMGALIAGVSIGTFPYTIDVIGKIISIRDFFITLFFVALGMQVRLPTLHVLHVASVVVSLAVVTRVFGIFLVLFLMGAGHRVSIHAFLNLCQMSEFALVILNYGVIENHVPAEMKAPVIWAFGILAVCSTYLNAFNEKICSAISSFLTVIGMRDNVGTALRQSMADMTNRRPIVMLGFHRLAASFVESILHNNPEMLESVMVLDFNHETQKMLLRQGIPCMYVDVANSESLREANIEHARVVLSTVDDSMLIGTTNEKIISRVKEICPFARIVVTAEGPSKALDLYKAGAAYVIQPYASVGDKLIPTVSSLMDDSQESVEASRARQTMHLHRGPDLLSGNYV